MPVQRSNAYKPRNYRLALGIQNADPANIRKLRALNDFAWYSGKVKFSLSASESGAPRIDAQLSAFGRHVIRSDEIRGRAIVSKLAPTPSSFDKPFNRPKRGLVSHLPARFDPIAEI